LGWLAARALPDARHEDFEAMAMHPTAPAEVALRDAALEYHRSPTCGKIAVTPTKPLSNQRDLSLAYSPGVAYACLAIEENPQLAAEFTSRANLVGVVTNGTAVLGLGDIGPLASKPVMEGKGCLFKAFAGIDVFDIELAERDPDKLVEIIAALEPTLGGINLEDIKAPECFYIERQLRERLAIPVFHDDQHGTAIISSAALLNALELVGKKIGEVKVAVSGAGAAAIACLDLMLELGLRRENVFVCDSKGVVHTERADRLDETKRRYAQATQARSLADVVRGADVFLGCSAAGVLLPEMVASMAARPVILALANPEPEIRPELARAVRPDCIIATGRSDYPNQVNNVLCFPYIFRGALDCGATKITEAMKIACVREIAALAKAEVSEDVAAAYSGKALRFGPDYIIPTPFDRRLILRIAPAVAQAAQASGVAARPLEDLVAYRQSLTRFTAHTGMFMSPVFQAARGSGKRIAYTEGEDERSLRAAQAVIDEGLARPILLGCAEVIQAGIQSTGLRMVPGEDFDLVDPSADERMGRYRNEHLALCGRDGITPEMAEQAMRHSNTPIAAMMVRAGDADGLLCGLVGAYDEHLAHIRRIIGAQDDAAPMAAMNALVLDRHTVFVADTFVNDDPDAQQLATIASMAVDQLQHFGIPAAVAFVSHSMFGSTSRPSALKMRQARDLFFALRPDVDVDGEMQGDAALDPQLRSRLFAGSTLKGPANVLVLPSLDAANILFNVLKVTGGQGVTVGPILLGAASPAHILTPSATVRRVINMTALVAVQSAAAAERPTPSHVNVNGVSP
jgi:malate dehydrogenase (oxaloacetate-decarboxylating)(NADP+)